MWKQFRTTRGQFINACGNCKRLDKGMEYGRAKGFLEMNQEVYKINRDAREGDKTPVTSRRGGPAQAPANYKV